MNQRKSTYRTWGNDDFIEATEWSNQEGFDVNFPDRRSANFTWKEFDELVKCVRELEAPSPQLHLFAYIPKGKL